MTLSPAASLAATTARLRDLCQRDVQAGWHSQAGERPTAALGQSLDLEAWPRAPQNERGYLVWPAGRQVQWYAQRWVLPTQWQGYPLTGLTLRLALTWWAEEAQLFVNGQFCQAGDLFDSSTRLVLTTAIEPGQTITVALRLVSPGHDIGGLMRSRLLAEAPSYDLAIALDPGFVADEIDVLAKYAAAFAPETLARIADIVGRLDWSLVEEANRFHQALRELRRDLEPFASDLKQRHVTLLGHAHLDMAWLWEVPETYEAAERTFRSVLALRREFPDLTFCHTSPALYAWFARERPPLWAEIRAAIASGCWEPLGGMWVEPDANLPNGESCVRQLLYGQRFTRDQFGAYTRVAWLTDTFGFQWQLPQLLKLAGIDYFVTQKLHWNDTTEFPHGVFWWQAPEGTRVLALMSPPNLAGVMDTNPQTLTDYTVKWEQQTGLQASFWLPGVGDHGGGPTRDMLQVQARWQQSPFFPRLQFGTATQFLDHLAALAGSPAAALAPNPSPGGRGASKSLPGSQGEKEPGDAGSQFPVWNDELYVELHRGCYTAHADQKYFNRRAEGLLYEAELWASLASMTQPEQAGFTYPGADLEAAWKRVLFNQFHDILPGTSIPGVFATANQDWRVAIARAEAIRHQALAALSAQIDPGPPPVDLAQPWVLFNSLNWPRAAVVEIPVAPGSWRAWSSQGQPLLCQLTAAGTLLVSVTDIPALGYALVWLQPMAPADTEGREPAVGSRGAWVLENEQVRGTIDKSTGQLTSLWDKEAQREVLSGPGNELQFFRDQGQYWDAWNLDPAYEQHPLPGAVVTEITWLERGPVRSRLRVTSQFQASTFQQEYSLVAGSRVLMMATTVNWQEQHVVVKAAFPCALEADVATYEIPCGAIARTTKPTTPQDQAKWEVCGQRWADLTANQGDYGVSLLNDSKYGYDHQPGRLRLTLLRAPQWPHPDCDRGRHQFTYALYPHPGSWQAAQTPRRAAELNLPVQVWALSGAKANLSRRLPAQTSLLTLDNETAMLMALKQSEVAPDCYILRFYEATGQGGDVALGGWLAPQVIGAVDLLERPCSEPANALRPWQVLSLAWRRGPES